MEERTAAAANASLTTPPSIVRKTNTDMGMMLPEYRKIEVETSRDTKMAIRTHADASGARNAPNVIVKKV